MAQSLYESLRPDDWAEQIAADLLPCSERGDCRGERYHDRNCPGFYRARVASALKEVADERSRND